jgi:hypothetical protein
LDRTNEQFFAYQSADLVLYLSHGFQPAVEQALKG